MAAGGFHDTIFDVAVAGGGPAGLAAGIALAGAGCRVALVAPPAGEPGTGREARTAALFTASLELLAKCGLWPAIRGETAALAGIRIVDRTVSPFGLRAPEVLFEACEIGRDAFGYNVPNAVLMRALREQARLADGLSIIDGSVTGLACREDRVSLRLADGSAIDSRILAAADGRGSICRKAAGIGESWQSSGQTALTAMLTHSRPHGSISTEFHRAAGPCTVVPLPDGEGGEHRSSLVWIERSVVADRLAKLDDRAFQAAVATQLVGLLGAIQGVEGRGRFELGFSRAKALARNRVLLMAEAAHAMPPIGAQGLNLSLRDVGAAVELVSAAVGAGRDPGGVDVLAAYERARGADIAGRMAAVEALNNSLLLDLGAVNLVRGAGLHALQAIPPLKRQVMRLGLG